jgi:ABC-type sugar transport system permease subunit
MTTTDAETREAEPGEPSKRGRRGRSEHAAAQNRLGLYLIGPSIIVLLIVIGYPVVRAVFMSFQKDAGLDPATGLFVEGGFAGFSNYTHWLFQRCGDIPCPPGTLGSQFWSSMWTTIFFTVATVVIEVCLGMWMALVMSRAFKGRGLMRASVLVPWSIPTAVTAKLWFFIFAFDGIANSLLRTEILWTGSQWPARFAVIIADVWKTTPFIALLILAGLQIIPEDVYEAAKVDGVHPVKVFFRVTLPLVRPALMVAIIFRLLDAMRIFDLIYVLTPNSKATKTMSIISRENLFDFDKFAYGSAQSTLLFLMIAAMTGLYIWLGKVRFDGGDR